MAQHVKHTKTPLQVKQERNARTKKLSRILIAFIIIVVSVLAGTFAFRYMTDSRIANGDSNVKDALTKADSSTSVTYTLLKLDTDIFSSVPDIYRNLSNSRTYCILRVDSSSNKVSICSLPANIAVTPSNSDERPLYAFEESGGDSHLVTSINDLMGVQINHFISLDSTGIKTLVDDLGGLDVTLSTQIDDPYSGTSVIEAGGAKRSGDEVLQILRARKFGNYYSTMPEVTSSIVINALSKLAERSDGDFQNILSNISKQLFSDMSSNDLGNSLNTFKKCDLSSAYKLKISGSSQTTTETNERVFEARTSEFSQMVAKFRDGEDPESSSMVSLTKSPETVSVEVRNGAGIVGAATKMSEIIKGAGYNVEKTGNAEEGYVYSETLVVYMDEEYESCAYDIVSKLGCGRVVFGGDYYTSSQNIISIVGSDWAPAG